jgi:uncharacterized membrane protein
MADVPIQFVVAAFKDEQAAQKALEALKQGQKDGVIHVDEAAVLVKGQDGVVHIKETSDMGAGKGAVIGGLLGAGVGLLMGPIGWAAAGGAGIGALAAKLRDGGFQDARLKQLGESLTPGSSAIVAVVEHTWVEKVEEMVAQEAVTVATETIADDISNQLKTGNDVMWTAVATSEGGVVGRATTSGTQPS